VVQHLPSKYEALLSNPSATKKKKKEFSRWALAGGSLEARSLRWREARRTEGRKKGGREGGREGRREGWKKDFLNINSQLILRTKDMSPLYQ
jgi:hypothetical protein